MYEVTGILGAVTLDPFFKAPLWEIAVVGFCLGFDHSDLIFSVTQRKKSPRGRKNLNLFFFFSRRCKH